jgi:uncharacterized protein (DUF302 family)
VIRVHRYGMGVSMPVPFQRALEVVTEALKAEGFGIVSQIDVRHTLKEKLGLETSNYMILGACNPHLAHRALTAEQNIGLLLPCNVIVYESDGGTEVQIQDPEIMSSVAGNAQLAPIAAEAKDRLLKVLRSLEAE